MRLNEVLNKSIQFFKDKNFDSARLDAELLIAHALKLNRIGLYLKHDQPLSEPEINLCREFIKRRSAGEPVAYIINEKGFYGLDFYVEPGVLVPRPETEMILDLAIQHQEKFQFENPRILDIGTGSGCIGLSALKNIKSSKLTAIDKSEIAQKVFLKNMDKLELKDSAQFILADFEKVNLSELGSFEFILSNPPYIANTDPRVQKSVRDFEPAEALFAADEGLALLKSWSQKTIQLLKPNGLMMMEMGMDQGDAMLKHFQLLNCFHSVEVVKDLAGLDRFIKGIKK